MEGILKYLIIGLIVYILFCKCSQFKNTWEYFSDFTVSPAEGGPIQKKLFVTPSPPTLPQKTPHWDHTFATKSLLRDDVVHMNALVNYFPMGKPPATIEKTQEEEIDVARSQFLPKFAKRKQ